jgi:pentatricopeptide repeat protein
MDQAMELFVVMRQRQIQPDSIVYNSLLDGCAKKQMVGLCEKVVNDMQEADVRLSNHSVSILVKLYGRSRNLEKAFKVVDEIPKKYGFVPNVAVFTCLMQACIWNGSLDKALALQSQMLKERQYPDEKTYSTLLRGALRAGRVEACTNLIYAALAQGGPALLNEELVQNVLVLSRQRRVWDEQGLPLLSTLRSKGIYINGLPDTTQNAAGIKPVADVNAAGIKPVADVQRGKQTSSRHTAGPRWSDMSM